MQRLETDEETNEDSSSERKTKVSSLPTSISVLCRYGSWAGGLMLLKCCFTSTETVGLLGTGAEDVHLDFYTAP